MIMLLIHIVEVCSHVSAAVKLNVSLHFICSRLSCLTSILSTCNIVRHMRTILSKGNTTLKHDVLQSEELYNHQF